MNYNQVLENARKNMGGRCKVCRECNGIGCKGSIPGPGGKGTGSSFVRNYQKLQDIKINMDLIYSKTPSDTTLELFGITLKYPFFAAPISAVKIHYPGHFTEEEYANSIVFGCKAAGIMGFTGDGESEDCYSSGLEAIKLSGGWGIPTIKPWSVENVIEKIKLLRKRELLRWPWT